MSAPDINKKVMDQFTEFSGDAHLTILLGAGASAPSGLPSWNQFATRLSTLSGLVANEDAAKILLGSQDPSIVLQAAHAKSGEQWNKHLVDALFGELVVPPEPSPLHLATAGHYAASPDKTTLATLNFDTLLESAMLIEVPQVYVDTDGEDPKDAPTIHHLHGLIFEDTTYSPIVGYSDFAELITDTDAWQRRFLSEALKRGPLLLAGTSYRDPVIRHWLHLIFRDEAPAFPALVTIVREGLELDKPSFDSISGALTSEWESIGLRALQMEDLTDVARVIRELKFASSKDYRTPQQRTRQMWSKHEKKFDILQAEYSDFLASDSQLIAEALGTKAVRATLWLANGKEKLARWATEGGRYRAIGDLKLVPTGHDSPLIAGETISAEEVQIKDVEREKLITPTWRSVLAIPIIVGDGVLPDFVVGVLTFGLSASAAPLLARKEDWWEVTKKLSSVWGQRLNSVAFPDREKQRTI